MLADGSITERIRYTIKLDSAGQMLEKLCNGGSAGKAIIRCTAKRLHAAQKER